MNHEIINSYEGFCTLKDEWNLLLRESAVNSPFLTWEWLDSWWQTHRTTEELCLITFRNNQKELMGIAPFVINRVKCGFFLKARAIYFMGLRLNHKLSEYLDIIIKKGLEEEICREVINVLSEMGTHWDVFLFYEVPETSLNLLKIKKLIDPLNWLCCQTSHGCSVINIPVSFDEYLKGLKPRIRTKLRSLPRRLKEKHEVELEICDKEDKLETNLSSFVTLHQKRWESKDQPGSFSNRKKREFFNILSSHFIKQKWLKIFSLKVDGHYRAHEYCFLYNNKLFVLQEGYEPAWNDKGVGNVLRTLVIRYCINNKIEEYDFLGGVTYHKNSWGVNIKNSVLYTFGKRNLRAIVFLYKPVIVENMRTLYRSLVPNALVQWRSDWIQARKAKKVRNALERKRLMDKKLYDQGVGFEHK